MGVKGKSSKLRKILLNFLVRHGKILSLTGSVMLFIPTIFLTERRVVLNRSMCKRLVMMVIGVILMGLGIALLSQSRFGADSFSCFNFGISSLTPLPFYACYWISSIILLIPGLLFARHLIHLGTLLSFFCTGLTAQFFINCFRKGFGKIHILPMRITLLCAGIIVFALAASLFFSSNLGLTPYDIMGFVLTQKIKIAYFWCRLGFDALFALTGFLFGARIGIGTLITALFLQPLIGVFNRYISIPILEQSLFES